MRTLLLGLIAAALGVSSAFLVACGDRNDLIPRSDADAINSDLDQASSLYDQEQCRASQAAVVRAEGRAGRLPPEVDSAQCGKTQSTQTTQTTATTPTTTATAPTTTTTPPTTTTTTPPTTTTAPPTTQTTTESGNNGGTPAGQESRNRGKGKGGG
jgi:hypothetical protein